VRRIADFLVKHAKPLLGATGLLSLAAAASLFGLRFNADVTSFLIDGNDSGRAYYTLEQKYGAADPIMVALELPPGESFEQLASVARLVDLRDTIAATPGVARVGAFVPALHPLTGRPLTAATVARLPPAALPLLLSSPAAELLLSTDRRGTLLVVAPLDDGIELVDRLAEIAPPDGWQMRVAGNPVVFASLLGMLGWFLLGIPPAVIALLLIVFYLNIGDRRLVAFSILPAVLGSLWTFGLISLSGIEVDIVTIIVPVFVIVMGSADGLHFVAHFQDSAATAPPETDTDADTANAAAARPVGALRVAHALRQVGVPMILTTVSTAAGFLALLATDVRPLRQLGIFAAAGIVFAGVISFFALPALLSRIRVAPKPRRAWLAPKLTGLLKAAARRRWVAVAFALPLAAFAVLFLPRLSVNPDQLFYFKDDHPVRAAFEHVSEVFGGATPVTGEFVFDPQGDVDSQLDTIRELSRRLEALPGVGTVFSLADLVPLLPPRQRPLALDPAAAGSAPSPFGKMIADDGLRFVLLPGELAADDVQTWLDFADAEPLIRAVTGVPVLLDQLSRLVLSAQTRSPAAAFVLVAALLLVAYRRLGQTMIALVPLALTTAVLLAFLAASGIQLNIITAIAASIVIGVGIDYAIHLVAAINHARSDGPGYVLRAIDTAGRPILANALGIAVGLSALLFSPLKPHTHISMIMWVAMLIGAVSALVLIPALLPRAGVEPSA
jgi:predicted RND superfamily exporter protein